MKIGILGTHGVGKTTIGHFLVSYFGQRGERSELIPEVARKILALGLPLNKETTLDAQLAIQYMQSIEELAAEHNITENKLDKVICDRTRLDNYIYTYNKFGEEARNLMYTDIFRWMQTHPYHILFKVPIYSSKIVNDGVRSTDKRFQERIDFLIDEFIQDHKMNINIMPKELFTNPETQPLLLKKYFDEKFSDKKAYMIDL